MWFCIIDYIFVLKLARGNKPTTDRETQSFQHMLQAMNTRRKISNIQLYIEENWFKRGIKEAIAIRKMRPTLNLDEAQYHWSAIYNHLIRSRLTIEIPEKGQKTPLYETTE